MIKPYQRAASSQPAEAAGRVPLGLMIIFVILFAGISSYFIVTAHPLLTGAGR
jgi:hypothetical protein